MLPNEGYVAYIYYVNGASECQVLFSQTIAADGSGRSSGTLTVDALSSHQFSFLIENSNDGSYAGTPEVTV